MLLSILGGLLLIFCCAGIRLWTMGRRQKDLPPGPPTEAFWGNIRLMPKSHTYQRFTEWAREYGSIFSLKISDSTIVVLSSPQAVYDVMERNGVALADRPVKHIAMLLTSGMMIGMAPYGSTWRGQRRAAHDILRPTSCMKHLPIQIAESNQLMYDILCNPEDTFFHIQRATLSVMLSVMFGTRIPTNRSPVFAMVFAIAAKLHKLMETGATPPIELIPWLKYIPARWAPWKAQAKEARTMQRSLLFDLLDQCEARELTGHGNGCYMEGVLKKAEAYALSREAVAYTGGSMINAGSTTSTAYLHFLILLLVEHHEVQEKARAELNRVVGLERMPSLDDMPNLPYIRAIVQEVHRCRPVAPIALPHKSMDDIYYGKYRIPQGSSVFANIWAIYRDPTLFDRPEDFYPDRYLSSALGFKKGVAEDIAKTDAFKRFNVLAFGTGRRACPGIHLASATLDLNVARLLWGFDFTNTWKVDDAGRCTKEKVDSWHFQSGATHDPYQFKCEAHVRSLQHAQVIKDAFVQSTPIFAPFEQGLAKEERDSANDARWNASL
ncbi:hypothetical protein FRB96_006566 [Tulasnella sp. 330]|nr:hypothetical protein FRB96_006566 [Tulasnella sp. 330]